MAAPRTRTPKVPAHTPNAAAPVWEQLRGLYPEAARVAGDAAARPMTGRDLLALELAEHGKLQREQSTATGKEIVSLLAARVQSRKNLRVLALLLGENRRDPDLTPPRIDPSMTRDAFRRHIAEWDLIGGDEILD
jgi:hypothetical protein